MARLPCRVARIPAHVTCAWACLITCALSDEQARVASAWRPEDRVAWLPLPEVSPHVSRGSHATRLDAITTPCTCPHSPVLTYLSPTPPGGRQHERRHAIGQLLRRVGQAPRPQAAAQGVVSRTSLVPPASSYQLRHRAGAYSRPYIPAYSLTAQGDSRGAQPTDARDRVDKRAPRSGGRGGVKVRVLRDRIHTRRTHASPGCLSCFERWTVLTVIGR